ncbi:MAG: hypothetical protein M1358_00745, partial [Chloroflexi bacterium]|nr:hypothetical protein [Chloroflexota bacterium]
MDLNQQVHPLHHYNEETIMDRKMRDELDRECGGVCPCCENEYGVEEAVRGNCFHCDQELPMEVLRAVPDEVAKVVLSQEKPIAVSPRGDIEPRIGEAQMSEEIYQRLLDMAQASNIKVREVTFPVDMKLNGEVIPQEIQEELRNNLGGYFASGEKGKLIDRK